MSHAQALKNGNFFAKFLFTFFANFLFATTRLFNQKATKKLLQRVVAVDVTVVVTDVVNYTNLGNTNIGVNRNISDDVQQ